MIADYPLTEGPYTVEDGERVYQGTDDTLPFDHPCADLPKRTDR